jgi:hypothetical protein
LEAKLQNLGKGLFSAAWDEGGEAEALAESFPQSPLFCVCRILDDRMFPLWLGDNFNLQLHPQAGVDRSSKKAALSSPARP